MEETKEKLEYTKMRERMEWALEMLKEQISKRALKISDTDLFNQACEITKTLFVRSEIQYSGKR